jgi:hypothetical protein
MRISHRELESCVRDPNAWMSERRSGRQRFYSIGYDQVLLLGIYRFHRGGSKREGETWIEALFQKHAAKLTMAQRRDSVRERYGRYTDWFRRAGVTVIERRVILAGRFQQFLTLGGFLHRVDATPTGVRGVILGEYRQSWRSELRMPLIQTAIGDRYGVNSADVAVAVQELDGNGLQEATFGPARLATAMREFRAISEYVRRRWGTGP